MTTTWSNEETKQAFPVGTRVRVKKNGDVGTVIDYRAYRTAFVGLVTFLAVQMDGASSDHEIHPGKVLASID